MADKYRIARLLGAGGMGAVYEAEHLTLRCPVALKMLLPRAFHSADAIARFQREAQQLAALRHPNIIEVRDLGRDADGSHYIEMELLRGAPLDALVQERPLAQERAIALVGQALAGLGAAHAQGIVHRDVKPANLFVTTTPTGADVVKVLDFGIAKVATELGLTSSDALLGTPLYMSPEQCRRTRDVDARADIYSIGAVLFELLTQRAPVSGSTLTEVLVLASQGEIERDVRRYRPDVPPWLAETIARALARSPDERFQSADEMRAALEHGASAGMRGDTLPLPPHSKTVQLPDGADVPPTRHGDDGARPASSGTRLPLALGASLALVACAAVAIVGWRIAAAPEPETAPTAGSAPSDTTPSEPQPPSPPEPAPPLAPDGMVWVAGGAFEMGSRPEEIAAVLASCETCQREGLERESPARAVVLSPFFLDGVEVTNEAFARWLAAQPGLELREGRLVMDAATLLADLDPAFGGVEQVDGRFRARAGLERHPVVQVTWHAAARYCEALGRRLPTEAEWELAARGAARRPYPWGEARPGCDGVAFGRHPTTGACAGGVTPGAAPVGSSAQDRTPEGVFDLGGNAAEWTLERFAERYAPCAPPCTDPGVAPAATDDEAPRAVRGGSWAEPASAVRAAGRSLLEPGRVRAYLGFRCALSAPR